MQATASSRSPRIFTASIGLLAFFLLSVAGFSGPLPLTNTQSGISLTLSGSNGVDWAVERLYHDASLGDQVIYLKSSVAFSLAHNAQNVITIETSVLPHVLGVAGKDGIPNSGDEGDIYYKVDRDMQAHTYNSLAGSLPTFAIKYSASATFDSLTYDGSKKVVGSTGDNGGAWGASPLSTTKRFAYGQLDSFGNEWHTLTYWDDDIPLLNAAGVYPHRQGASDGLCVFVCVNPKTPVIQCTATGTEQFYTTPIKTYFIPKIWEQTTYLTSGVQLGLLNLTNGEPIFYRVQGGAWQQYAGSPLTAATLCGSNPTVLLETKCGQNGVVLRRQIVCNPDYPALSEAHGNLLWADETERLAVVNKVHNTPPFKNAYSQYRGSYYQGSTTTFNDTRGIWRDGASQATQSLANAFVVAMEGPTTAATELQLCKTRLLRVARLQPVGFEVTINDATPAKDFLNELSQTLQCFADAAIAYDLIAARARKSQTAQGITAIEEIFIRDSLAKIAKSILQFRDNYGTNNGSGDTHWAHGYEFTFGTIALAMPTYKTAYYGTSGGDRQTINDTADANGKFWNPFPDQAVTWYQAATDPDIAIPGYPNVVGRFRAEFLMTDDGWWSGPNDLQADGDRYYTGARGHQLADVNYGGLANADCRVELVEMAGYESPFVARLHSFDFMRRIKGDNRRPLSTTNYIRRHLVGGVVPLTWDATSKTYSAQPPEGQTAIYAFNSHFEFASVPAAVSLVSQYLNDVIAFDKGTIDPSKKATVDSTRSLLYDARALALCADPATLPTHQTEPNHAPIIKPLFKHVVKPGEMIVKDIIAMDPDGDALTLQLNGLPAGAAYDSVRRRITWTPGAADTGVYLVTVTASDGKTSTSRPFPIAVSTNARLTVNQPNSFNAVLPSGGGSITLSWSSPAGTSTPSYYFIYKDGILFHVSKGDELTYSDNELLAGGESTRYAISAMYPSGSESVAAFPNPAILHLSGSYGLTASQVFADWMSAHGVSGSPSDMFSADRDGDGVANGLEYALGANRLPGDPVILVTSTNGSLLVGMLKQSPDTAAYVDLAIQCSTDLLDWSYPVALVTDSTGLPTNRAWYVAQGLQDRAFFRLNAVLKP